MSTAYKLGENAKLYYSATPVVAVATTSLASGVTAIAANVKNVKITAKNETPDRTTRNNGGVKAYGNSLTDFTIAFEIQVPGTGVTDAAYTAFQSAWTGKSEIAAYELSDLSSVAGAEGPGGNWIVASFERDDANGTVQFATVELKPSTYNGWVICTGS